MEFVRCGDSMRVAKLSEKHFLQSTALRGREPSLRQFVVAIALTLFFAIDISVRVRHLIHMTAILIFHLLPPKLSLREHKLRSLSCMTTTKYERSWNFLFFAQAVDALVAGSIEFQWKNTFLLHFLQTVTWRGIFTNLLQIWRISRIPFPY